MVKPVCFTTKHVLIKKMVDAVEEECGERAVDNVDFEGLAKAYINQMHDELYRLESECILAAKLQSVGATKVIKITPPAREPEGPLYRS